MPRKSHGSIRRIQDVTFHELGESPSHYVIAGPHGEQARRSAPPGGRSWRRQILIRGRYLEVAAKSDLHFFDRTNARRQDSRILSIVNFHLEPHLARRAGIVFTTFVCSRAR